jgi:peptidoglycan/LPS O-acetylase OafA/YrhL
VLERCKNAPSPGYRLLSAIATCTASAVVVAAVLPTVSEVSNYKSMHIWEFVALIELLIPLLYFRPKWNRKIITIAGLLGGILSLLVSPSPIRPELNIECTGRLIGALILIYLIAREVSHDTSVQDQPQPEEELS